MPNGKSTAGIYLSPTLFCIELLSISVYGVQQHNSGLVGSSLTSFGGGLCMQTARVALPNTYHASGAGKSYCQ